MTSTIDLDGEDFLPEKQNLDSLVSEALLTTEAWLFVCGLVCDRAPVKRAI